MQLRKQRRLTAGFSMIEVLVTLLILAIGIMGLIGMQVLSAKNVNNSQMRTVANNFAYDIVDRMRANPAGVSAGNYNAITGSETSTTTCTSTCTVAQIATLDAVQWNANIKRSFANGGLGTDANGTVTRNGNVHIVTLTWKEQNKSSTGGGSVVDKTLSLQVRLL